MLKFSEPSINCIKHTYQLVRIVEPTNGKNGFKEYKCTKCKKIYKEEILNRGY